ncbi:putative bifunctional diguanylate cyclase/phosphodiesterase [Sporosarcina luteola]|uniref:putative bifunctional diguanylate cyclase/phosphodiesterase n=1 Tax=Sporosarcina luteola TaxID=582850 RepID=UPI00203F0A02|nr:EAL domain-containing protein [Sporosarcina luteola]MCM3710105.1 EAL domain-containing protein [Sporosarcina luteola]
MDSNRLQDELMLERNSRLEFEHKYKSVIDHNLDPIITINLSGRISYANIAVHKAFGYRLKELTGRAIIDLIGEEKNNEFNDFLSRAFSGESIEMEGIKFFHKRGKYLSAYVKTIPVAIRGDIKEIHLILRDTSFHLKNNERLLFLSYHDQLTGLWNRRALKEHFDADADYAFRCDEQLSLIQLDLDRFNTINDSIGRNGADEILKMIADRIKLVIPKAGKLYRNGGDEYIILLQNHSIEKTEKLTQKIMSDFTKPFYFNRQEYFISSSIGISVYPEDGTELEELLQKAEQAVRFVKERGRSHYRFYREEMNTAFTDTALMEAHLRRAIEFNELELHYQPQVNLKTGEIDSFEALLRWNNRKFGFVSPAEFIPLAEESGLIHSIGDWVLEVVCAQLKEWQDKQFRPVRIAVNISPKQFQIGAFAEKAKQIIEKHGIHPSSFEVEITESALMNMKDTLSTLQKLKEIGVTISVDDFGTGYSSLSYLKQYPIDIIKIDRSFIKDIELDEKNEAIAKTIINLAHNLGMQVIAEGVEKDLQAEILKEADCHKAQGYLFSKAVPASEIAERYFA